MLSISPAKPEDHIAISQLTKLSKAHWGYSKAQMEVWDEDLTVSKEYIAESIVYKLIEDERLIAYYSCVRINATTLKLDNLFIHPDSMGRGLGRMLMEDIFKRGKSQGIDTLTLDSDPHAEGFYKKLGFKVVGKLETSIPGRYLPIMTLALLN